MAGKYYALMRSTFPSPHYPICCRNQNTFIAKVTPCPANPRESGYPKLLDDYDLKAWYDNMAQSSPITADVYLRRLGSFCTRNSLYSKNSSQALEDLDLPEIEIHPRKHEVSFRKTPTIVRVRSNLSKAGLEYFSFLTEEGYK